MQSFDVVVDVSLNAVLNEQIKQLNGLQFHRLLRPCDVLPITSL